MSAAPRKEVTTREVVAVRFGMLTDDEVRRLSVKRITSPVTYDTLMNAVPDGLYDAALGPVDFNGRCGTCGLGAQQCPGHFGHVELPVPVYNPLVFGALYRLVRATCFHCGHFKMGRVEARAFLERLECLARGDLAAAQELRSGARTTKAARDAAEGILAAAEDEDALLGETDAQRAEKRAALAEADRREHARRPRQPLTCHVQEALRDAAAEFFARVPQAKCANCGAAAPSVKRQGATKLFREFSRKALVGNLMRGIDMGGDPELRALLGDRRALAAAAAADGGRERGGGGGGGKGGGKRMRSEVDGDDGGWDSDAEEALAGGEDEEKKQQAGGGAKKEERAGSSSSSSDDSSSDSDSGSDSSSDDDGDGGDKKGVKKAEANGAGAGGAALGKAAAAAAGRIEALAGAKYMLPAQVQALLLRLCEHEAPLLRRLYGCAGALGADAGAGAGAAAPAAGGRAWGEAALEGAAKASAKAAAGGAGAGAGAAALAKVFFLRALAVPPNRFRPPSVLGDQKYEHGQNVALQRILNAALSLQSSPSAAEAAALAPAERAAEQERFTQGWLRLQQEVNALIDSTTAENSEAPGIRQQLEKKEGLFRKNMMGKRVNFAARSVISPDPFIGAGEIGVPPYFATRLSFPGERRGGWWPRAAWRGLVGKWGVGGEGERHRGRGQVAGAASLLPRRKKTQTHPSPSNNHHHHPLTNRVRHAVERRAPAPPRRGRPAVPRRRRRRGLGGAHRAARQARAREARRPRQAPAVGLPRRGACRRRGGRRRARVGQGQRGRRSRGGRGGCGGHARGGRAAARVGRVPPPDGRRHHADQPPADAAQAGPHGAQVSFLCGVEGHRGARGGEDGRQRDRQADNQRSTYPNPNQQPPPSPLSPPTIITSGRASSRASARSASTTPTARRSTPTSTATRSTCTCRRTSTAAPRATASCTPTASSSCRPTASRSGG